MIPMRKIFAAAAMIITFGMCLPASGADAGERIAVLVGSSEPPFEETLTGFQRYLTKQGIESEFDDLPHCG